MSVHGIENAFVSSARGRTTYGFYYHILPVVALRMVTTVFTWEIDIHIMAYRSYKRTIYSAYTNALSKFQKTKVSIIRTPGTRSERGPLGDPVSRFGRRETIVLRLSRRVGRCILGSPRLISRLGSWLLVDRLQPCGGEVK